MVRVDLCAYIYTCIYIQVYIILYVCVYVPFYRVSGRDQESWCERVNRRVIQYIHLSLYIEEFSAIHLRTSTTDHFQNIPVVICTNFVNYNSEHLSKWSGFQVISETRQYIAIPAPIIIFIIIYFPIYK